MKERKGKNMMTSEERKKKRDQRCRHFNGIQNDLCEAKIGYPEYKNNLPCFGNTDQPCDGYSPFTAEELVEQEAKIQRHMELMQKGLSSCCEEPFDTSQVIQSGEFKNHGPRFCSKCGKLAFMV